MANNLYDYLNQFTLGQAGAVGKNILQGATDVLNRYQIGTRGITRGVPIQQRPVVNPSFLRPDYSGAGERARRFQEYQTGRDIPGANTDYSARLGVGSPADRAYEAEKSRVAQLTAQDPELQRYERARSVAKTQEEMNAVRDEGMRIWAAKHGGLAAKVKPGSSGYEAIQSSIGPSTASALSNEQVLGLMSFDPNTVLKTTQGIQGQFRPNQQLTGQEILSAMSFDPNVAMQSAANMAYAPMSSAEAAMLQEVGGAQGEYITPMNAAGGVGQARGNTALFEELLKRAASKK